MRLFFKIDSLFACYTKKYLIEYYIVRIVLEIIFFTLIQYGELMNLDIIKQLSRTSNKVCLAKNEKGMSVVVKKYQDIKTLNIETTILNQLSVSGYAPKIIEMGEDFIIYEYIEGDLLKDKFLLYTMSDNVDGLIRLANELSIFLQIFYTLADNYILKDISFDNFIIKDGRCYGIDYDSVEEGMQYTDIAGVIAYAVTNCAGSIYSAFPFIKRILTNFRYQMIDVINEVRICLNSSKKIINIDSVLNDLLLIDDKKNEKFLQK